MLWDEKKIIEAIGAMRQWLNEDRITDPKKMVTSEELMHWLTFYQEQPSVKRNPSDIIVTCLSLDCPERNGGECKMQRKRTPDLVYICPSRVKDI